MSQITTETVTIAAKDGSGDFSAYLSKPESGNGPAIVVIQEIFGVNAGLRTMCDRWAAAGYVAICPDLFWRQEPGVDLTDQTEEEWQKAFALYNGFDVDKGIEDIAATIDFIRGHGRSTGKVGAVGYCLGGLLAYLTATRTDADASVSYYGVGIQDKLDEAAKITRPLMLHIAGKDEFVDAAAQAAIHDGLDGHAQSTLYDYPEADHAFSRINGQHYREDDATRANERTAAFFADHLKG